jgi:hypothetical protein
LQETIVAANFNRDGEPNLAAIGFNIVSNGVRFYVMYGNGEGSISTPSF